MLADADHGWGKPLGVKRVLRQRMDEYGRARPRFVRASIVEGIRIAALEKDETPRTARDDLRKLMDAGHIVRVRHPLGFVAVLTSLEDNGRARFFAQWLGVDREGTFEDTSTLELVEA